MNVENIELTRRVITDLMEQRRIHEGTPADVHTEYREEDPSLEGDFLDMGGWLTECECGTAACLAGWLASDPEVKAVGLRLEESIDGLCPAYGKTTAMFAMRDFLGFKEVSSACHVFRADNPNTFASGLQRLEEAISAETRGVEVRYGYDHV